MHPRIGITTSFEDGRQRIDHAYVQAVERVGGLPLLLPMAERTETSHALFDGLDAFIMTGGPAITDGLITEGFVHDDPSSTRPDDLGETPLVRSTSDRVLMREAMRRKLPILGICYGMQLLNALLGGTIYADAESQVEGAGTHSADRGARSHPIRVLPDTQLAALLDIDTLSVNTRHVQAIASVGAGLRVSATAPDGIIEAIEHENGRWLGVQFHPEAMSPPMDALFEHLVKMARMHSAGVLS